MVVGFSGCTLISDAEIQRKLGTATSDPVTDADTDVDADADTDTGSVGNPDSGDTDSGSITDTDSVHDSAQVIDAETGESDADTDTDADSDADTDTDTDVDTSPIPSDGVADWTDEGSLPESRAYATAVFNGVASSVLVFGGQGYHRLPKTLLSYDFGTSAWSEVATTGTAPGGRLGHGAVVDVPTERMLVMFGEGYYGLSDDVYEFDLSGLRWDVLPPSGASPEPRTGAAVVVDEDGGRAIVVGGSGYNGLLGDVWELDLTVTGSAAWSELSPTGTLLPRAFSAAAFDPQYRSLYLFGGVEYHGLAEDIACLDVDAMSWSPVLVVGDSPPPAEDPSAIWAAEYEAALVHGGAAYHGMLEQSWLMVGTDVCTLEGIELANAGDEPGALSGAVLTWIPGDALGLSVGGQNLHQLSAETRTVVP